jgi:tetratricopeptide (TPR) repeat protein
MFCIRTACALLVCLFFSAAFKAAASPAPVSVPEGYFPDYLKKAASSYNRGDISGALEQLQAVKGSKAAKRLPEKLYFLEGLALRQQGHAGPAREAFRTSLQYRGSNSDVVHYLALTALEEGDKPEALRLFKEALWFKRFTLAQPEESHYQLALLYEGLNAPLKAIQACRDALALKPDYSPARAKLADLLFSDGKQEEAITALRQGLSKDPKNRELELRLARQLLANSDRSLNAKGLSEALEIATKLVAQKPPPERFQDPAFGVYIRALLDNHKLEEAQQKIAEAQAAIPGNSEISTLAEQVALEAQAGEFQSSSSSSSDESSSSSSKMEGVEVPAQ